MRPKVCFKKSKIAKGLAFELALVRMTGKEGYGRVFILRGLNELALMRMGEMENHRMVLAFSQNISERLRARVQQLMKNSMETKTDGPWSSEFRCCLDLYDNIA